MLRLLLLSTMLSAAACQAESDTGPADTSLRRDLGGTPGDMASTDSSRDASHDAGLDTGLDTGPADGPVEIATSSGAIRGERQAGQAVFKGIPYAMPPIGSLRWESPQPMDWAGTRDATSFGARCAQPNINFATLQGAEDCLTLNVWSALDGTSRPVMVWFHGGSFIQGSASERTYHGSDLAQHDVVVVTVNYRLGALGFLAHPEIGERNVGLQDQLAALDWIKTNARALGGDPENMTVFGESAGGIASCLMVAGGHDQGRFQRAISESGPCSGLLRLPDISEAQAQGAALAAAVGCEAEPDVAACLRDVDAETIATALGFRPGVIFGDGVSWTPVRDGDLVPLDVDAALAASTTPMLMGGNAAEGALVEVAVNLGVVAVDYTTATAQMFPEQVNEVRSRYPLADFADDAGAVAAIVSDRFVCGTRRVARIRAGAGHPVWLYHFTHPFVTPIGDLGAMHGAELPFVFGTELTLVKLREEQIPLSELMQRYWTRFASSGDPGGDGDPVWPQYGPSSDEHLVLDLTTASGAGLRAATCDFWDSIDDAS